MPGHGMMIALGLLLCAVCGLYLALNDRHGVLGRVRHGERPARTSTERYGLKLAACKGCRRGECSAMREKRQRKEANPGDSHASRAEFKTAVQLNLGNVQKRGQVMGVLMDGRGLPPFIF
jgi:hypothetical protein